MASTPAVEPRATSLAVSFPLGVRGEYKHEPQRTARTANEYAEERRIYKDLISKNEK